MSIISISGRITDQHNNPVEGMTVRMREGSTTGTIVDTTTTDANGDYTVTHPSDSGTYYADPTALSPHYSDPGVGNGWFAPQTVTGENFTSTFSNNNPTRGTVGDRSYEQDSGTHTVDKTMSDSDAGDVLTPVKDSGPAWATLSKVDNGTYRWSFDTTGVAVGNYSCSYHIEDDYGGSSSTETFNVEITETNQPPSLTNPGPKSYANNSGNQTFQLEASDPESDPLTFSKTGGPSWGTVDSNTGVVTINTNTATRGDHTFDWRVDAFGGFDEQGHTVTITNNAPVLSNPGTRIYDRASGEQTFTLEATDADDDPLSFSKVSGPAWVTLSGDLVSVDTDAAPEGTHSVTWEVSDGQGGTDQETHDIVIGAANEAGWFQVAG